MSHTNTLDSGLDMSRSDEVHQSPRLLIFVFGFVMFTTGACGLISQYVLATMSTYILGNSIEQFSIIIASMMLMMGVSNWAQASLKDKYLVSTFIWIEVLIALLGGFAPILIYAAFGNMSDHFMVVHYFFILSIGFLIGFEIPVVIRILEKNNVDIKVNIQAVYAMDYIGAFFGALIWVYFLLKNFPLPEISFLVAGTNFIVAALAVLYFMKQKIVRATKWVFLLLLCTGVALFWGYSQNRDWSNLLEQKFYDDPIAYKVTTKYQHLVLTENKKLNDFRLYINGNAQFSSRDEQRYHDLLVHPAFALNPYANNVLILGGGDGLALREVLKYPNVEAVTMVDLDPGMTQFASSHPIMRKLNGNAFQDARVSTHASSGITRIGVEDVYIETGKLGDNKQPKTERVAQVDIINIDADRFVSSLHKDKWDVVIIDFPDPSSIELAKLYSREFYKKLQWLMSSDTIITIQSTSPYHAKEAYLTIQRTMEAAGLKTIAYRQNIPSFGDWGYFVAWKSDTSVNNMKKRIENIDKFAVETQFITPEVLKASLAFGKGELSSDKDCVNSLMMPCLLDLYTHQSWIIN